MHSSSLCCSFSMELSSSSSSPTSSRQRHVYISVQCEDPAKFTTEMIDKSLVARGVPTFKDIKQLRRNQRGTELGDELREAIRMSTISIILFSKEYMYSSWCLEELVMILESRKKWGTIVVPIFYAVDPSDIRKQRGYAAKIVGIQRVGGFWRRRWTDALTQAGNLCGWDHRGNITSESMFVGHVVTDIVNKRIPTNLIISIYPLRYDTCHEYLNLFLQVGSKDVLMVGICGPNRMGKTAIANSIYRQISYTFEGSSFLTDIGQNSKQPNGLIYLQEKLLCDVLLERNIAIKNTARGRDMIKEKLCFKRVLIVLDNVDDLEQLDSLVGSRNWFGSGTKIIITTRDVSLLNLLGVDQVLLAQGLPLPPNIQDVWDVFQQSRHTVAGLKDYIQNFYNMHKERVRYLENCLLREQRKNAAQERVILELKEIEGRDCGLLQATPTRCHDGKI